MPNFSQALMRPVSSTLNNCELEHIERTAIDVDRARDQQQEYRRTLETLGVKVHMLPELDEHPDACFVEDPVVQLGNEWVILQMGNSARRGEEQPIKSWLSNQGVQTIEMAGEATADGGDVLSIDRVAYVGISSRTNASGFEFLRRVGRRNGIDVWPIQVRKVLHLKTACTALNSHCLIGDMNTLGEGSQLLQQHFEIIRPEPEESAACNIVVVGQTVLVPASCPRAGETLTARGFNVLPVDISEFQKAEAGLTCLARFFSA
jgi:dimethylargininase